MAALPPLCMLILEEVLDCTDKDMQLLLDSDDDKDIDIIAAVSKFMRRNLKRNEYFYEEVVQSYSLDEFRSHFRMSRGTV